MAPGKANTPSARILNQAAAHLNEGQTRQAEVLIRDVLQSEPDNHEALNLFGSIALNSGHAPQAVEIFSRAAHLHGAEAEYHCNLGVALLQSDRMDEGEAALHAALKLKPAHGLANFNLGLCDLQSGRFDDARRRLEKAVRRMPKNLSALNALGVAHSKCGKPAKAVQLFRAVLKAQPDDPDARLNLAGALTETGKTDEAIGLYEQLIADYPGEARLHFNLGVALAAASLDQRAISACQQALVLEPDMVEAHVNLSSLYADRGNQDGALEHSKAASALRPGDIHIMINEARALRDSGMGTDALAACDRILDLAPGDADALGIQMNVLQNDGRFAEARTLAAGATPLPVLLALAQDQDYTFADGDIQSLKDAATASGADPGDAARAWFALARIHHGRRDFAAAFGFYKRGNALRDAAYNWSEADEQANLAAHLECFTATFFESHGRMGQDSGRPVFIVGMPRSGTTLVEQIIASHPDAAGGGEMSLVQTMADALTDGLGSAASYPACVADLDAATADALVAQYLEHLDRVSDTAARVTDKMPGNFWHLGLISRLFPKTRIIHCRRDAMATCFSIFQQMFAGYHPYAYDLGKLGRRQRSHDRLMEHWRQVLPLPLLDVAYEDLVADQEGQSRRIVEFCGLDWDEQVLNFHETRRNIQTASLWQVRQPIYTNALAGWRAYEEFLGPLREALSQV
ncbi:MAG: sulfotransferase [Alphaproteobacteria bacterium]|jgi:tetratricopeptide (TPR) repeat protein|nr:sulfotransferase [Alphaproteobacteria bacterium]MDP6831847.1 sulfotransferase [Alphaproteobacteria bacterium]